MDLLVPVPPIKWMSALTMVSRRAGGAANELLGAGVPAQTEPDAKKSWAPSLRARLMLNVMIRRAKVRVIRAAVALLSLTMCLVAVTACGGGNKIAMPSSSKDFKGSQYEDVVATLNDAGFTNVTAEADRDLIVGWLHDEGEVEEVVADGDKSFSKNKYFPADATIIVKYHAFPEGATPDGDSKPTPRPVETPSEATTSEESPTAVPSQAPEPSDSLLLTPDNNEEFAALLQVKDPGDASVKDFSEKYRGQTIEFDGNVASLNPSAGSAADVLVGAGDYSSDEAHGPSFKFENLNTDDPSIVSPSGASLSVGDNIHVVAKVGEYKGASQLFVLQAVSIARR